MSVAGQESSSSGAMVFPLAPALSQWPAKALAVVIVLVPVLSAGVAGMFAVASARGAANVQLIELAVGILREPPGPKTVDLRIWALNIIEKYSAVELPENLKRDLTDSIPLPSVTLAPAPHPVGVVWSTPDGGTISPTGVFMAPSTPGTYRVVGCMVGGNLCDTTVAVVGAPPLGPLRKP